MNINNWSPRKKIAAILLGILAIVGIIITIFLVQRQQEIRSRAEKATVLSITPPNQNIEAGGDGQLEVVVNPGVNQVSFIKTTVKFDPDKFDLTKDSFKLNSELGWTFLKDPAVENGELTFVVGVGADPTRVIAENSQKIGKINFTVKSDASGGDSKITFDEDKTQILSVGAADPFSQNVLSSTIPATVTIGAPVCRPNIGTCSWDAVDGATSYHYGISEVVSSPNGDEATLIKDGDTSDTSVEFPSVPGKRYSCVVSAINQCGTSDKAQGESTCPLPSVTPTPTPSPSPSPSSSPTPTEEVQPTETPTPTEIVVVTTTLTPPQGGVVTTTPIPTLPPTGNPFVVGGMIGGVLFILGGLALLFL